MIYISNLEPNPLNSGTNEFELTAFLKYNELTDASKEKIDFQLNRLGRNINKDKLIIAKVPFFSEDKDTKQKYIITKIEDFYDALDKYDKIINYKEANFTIYNKISNLIIRAKKIEPNIRSDGFIIKYENEIYDIVFEDNKNSSMETIEKACSKIIGKRIFIRKRNIIDMFERANNYEN